MKASMIFAILVAAVGLVGHAASRNVVFYDPQRSSKSLENVLEELAKPLAVDPKYTLRYQEGAQVWVVIAAAKDKETPKTILNKFSIKDLVALNYYDDTDCSGDRLSQRREFCEKLAKNKNGKDSPKDELVRSNLAKYCWTIFEHIGAECPFRPLFAKTARDVSILADFEMKVYRAMLDHISICLPGWECVKSWTLDRAVDEVIGKVSTSAPSYMDGLKRICSILNEEDVIDGKRTKAFLQAVPIGPSWPEYLQVCKLVVQKFKL